MALGRGCSYKNHCPQRNREDKYFHQQWCDNDLNCGRCVYRPGNTGNKQSRQEMEKYRNDQANGSLTVIIIFIAVIAYIWWKFHS